MPKPLAKLSNYSTLVKNVTRELSQLEMIVRRQTAKTYWMVGKFIDTHLLANKDRGEYGATVIERLADDIGRDASLLNRSLKFYRTYPILVARPELTWDHYRALITVKDDKQRKKLEAQVVRNNWNTRRLRKYLNTKRAIQGLSTNGNNTPVERLAFTRGRLNVYAVIEGKIDFGFKVKLDPGELGGARIKSDGYVEIAAGKKPRLKKVTVDANELYTYTATVVKVVDGDTLDADLALGFGITIEQRLRLRGIDCPEMDTQEGQKAKRFVAARLKQGALIVVKTYKDRPDKFDRYLADVFYKTGESDPSVVAGEGIYLNQELLDDHLARLY